MWMIFELSVVADRSFLPKFAYTAGHAHAENGMFSRSLHGYNFLTKKDFKNRLSPLNCTRKGDQSCFFKIFEKSFLAVFRFDPPKFFQRTGQNSLRNPPEHTKFFIASIEKGQADILVIKAGRKWVTPGVKIGVKVQTKK